MALQFLTKRLTILGDLVGHLIWYKTSLLIVFSLKRFLECATGFEKRFFYLTNSRISLLPTLFFFYITAAELRNLSSNLVEFGKKVDSEAQSEGIRFDHRFGQISA